MYLVVIWFVVAVAMTVLVEGVEFFSAAILAGFVALPVYVVYGIWKGGRQIDNFGRDFLVGRARENYMAKHPESFADGKFKSCHNCTENSVFLKQVGNTSHGIHNSHICRGCGTELWRSNLTHE